MVLNIHPQINLYFQMLNLFIDKNINLTTVNKEKSYILYQYSKIKLIIHCLL